jgi:hypothetical protein
VRHQFEPAIDRCRQCDDPCCAECLVYSFGPDTPPFCVHCALAAAGVRVRGSRPTKVSRRELRRREKEAKAAAKAAEEAARREPVIDWSIPGADDVAGADPAFRWADAPDDASAPLGGFEWVDDATGGGDDAPETVRWGGPAEGATEGPAPDWREGRAEGGPAGHVVPF